MDNVIRLLNETMVAAANVANELYLSMDGWMVKPDPSSYHRYQQAVDVVHKCEGMLEALTVVYESN